MRRQAIAHAVRALCVIVEAGCATVPADAGFGDVQKLVTDGASLDIQWNRDTPADRAVTEKVHSMLAREITVEEAVQITLLNNAGLQATYEDLGIAQADLVEAGLLQNPVFEFEIRFPGDPRPPLEAHIIQNFLDLFLLPLKKRVATARFEQAKMKVADEVIDVAAQVRSAFYELQAAQQLLEMRRSVAEATKASVDAALQLHAAGNLTDLELENEQAMCAEAKLDLAQAETDAREGRERLNILMGVWGNDTEWTISNRLPELPGSEISSEGLETLAVSRSFELQAARLDVEATAQSLGLTRASAFIPELNVGIHSEREPDGFNSVGPSIGFQLPLFNQGQPLKARAQALLRRVQQRYVDAAVSLRANVRRLRDRMLAARRSVEYQVAVALPLRSRIVEHTQLEYNAMQIGVFQLLQAKQGEIKAGRDYIEALRSYWVARSELEHVVGGQLSADVPAHDPPRNAQEEYHHDEKAPENDQNEEPAKTHHHGGKP